MEILVSLIAWQIQKDATAQATNKRERHTTKRQRLDRQTADEHPPNLRSLSSWLPLK